jgi:unsaturated rhamnogalacturonyl hydrolase
MLNPQQMAAMVREALLAMQRHSWEQGVAAQALLEMGENEVVVMMAREAANRQLPDGRLAMLGGQGAVTDPAAIGEALLFAARIANDPALQHAADEQLAWLLERAPRTPDGTLHHVLDQPQVWVDSFFMAPPFLAAAGRFDEALRQIEGFRRLLWDAEKRLYHHIWDDGAQAFTRAAYWGVGNGWAVAGIARVLDALPPEMADERARLAGYVREGLDGCLAWQRPDALFHDVLDDPATFVETNLAQMLAYTIYRGLRGEWLPGSYLAAADRMRAAVHQKVDGYGFVQGVCAAPTFDRPGIAPEGQAFFLLMEAAATRLLGPAEEDETPRRNLRGARRGARRL